jgi:hypothetical protein
MLFTLFNCHLDLWLKSCTHFLFDFYFFIYFFLLFMWGLTGIGFYIYLNIVRTHGSEADAMFFSLFLIFLIFQCYSF